MTIEPDKITPEAGAASPPPRGRSRTMKFAGAAVLILAVGAAGGVAASRYVHRHQPLAVMLLQPSPIASLKNDMPVAIKGQVAEVFGSKFIVQDDSGRALVDTGPRGDRAKLVTKGDAVTVQGRFDRGFIHAQLMTRADGTTEAFGPPRPHHGPGGPRGPHGDRWAGGPGGFGGPGQGPGMMSGPGNDPGNGPDRGPPSPAAN